MVWLGETKFLYVTMKEEEWKKLFVLCLSKDLSRKLLFYIVK